MGSTISGHLGTSYGPQILLDPQLASAEPSNYIEGDSQMLTYVWNMDSVETVIVDVRILLPNGIVVASQYAYLPTTDRSLNLFTQQMTEGFILSIGVRGRTNGRVGSTFVRIVLCRGNPVSLVTAQVWVQGYVNGLTRLSWPNGSLRQSNDGDGNIRSIVGSIPAAGAEVSETVPTGAIWQPISFLVSLNSSVAVANRVVALQIDDGAGIYSMTNTGNNQAASLIWNYTFASGLQPAVQFNAQLTAGFPANLFMTAGHRLRTKTTNIQAADQYMVVQYLVMEWLST